MEFQYALHEIDQAALWLKSNIEDRKIICFNAEMGAGKTTLIKAFCNLLGVLDPMNSPSFGIVNEYLTQENNKVFHFDLYRIKHIEELIAIGFEEYLHSGKYCLIEWPQIAEQILQDETMAIVMIHGTGSSRTIELKFYPNEIL
jgi:tRNA threonylcarbamoyladenosine biosynthesis protein TsaE